jgi:hypothetical protein
MRDTTGFEIGGIHRTDTAAGRRFRPEVNPT